jgi:DNA-binding Lrp family transcriptional regulator
MDMKELTTKEFAEEQGLSAPVAAGVIKFLEKAGYIKKVGTRKAQSKTGQGRSSNVYEIPEEIVLRL